MRILSLILLILCVSCAKSNKETPEKPVGVTDSLAGIRPETVVDSSKLVKVVYNNDRGTYYDKEAYEGFKKWFNKLNPNYISAPRVAQEIYLKEKIAADKSNAEYKVASDQKFHYLYAHFIQKRNGIETYAELRKKTVAIFSRINAINCELDYDCGIYFSFQRTAIAAYAEYAINNYKTYPYAFEKKYPIGKQKSLYLQMLKQKIADGLEEMSTEKYSQYGRLKKDKREEYKKGVLIYVNQLDSLIQTHFDLSVAQQYQYGHYQ
ncbi:hypothetical protein OGH69_02375 [Flavobacterium sp. MFBS3-15]|uniref:hypothetical protein n=1 Tax=Flavobacterium sp. MFBS3-15 TaxID=2989816 RepID=UPI0022362B2D|nr:hypothetical protein [Flavobacterium sp. MFBS3-15]MCW4467796.1 hypothetical protein [Flavobacterium sp. MFBS3-15]